MTGKKTMKPWERQPWESVTAFDRFCTFYLSQEPPRSVVAAYNNYLTSRGLKGDRTSAPGTWNCWAQARSYRSNKKIPGGLTWQERADAWDRYQEELRMAALAREQRKKAEQWAKRRAELAEKEFEIAEKLLDRAMQMLKSTLYRKHVRNGTVVIEPSNWREADIAANAKLGSELARRAAGMPKETIAVDDWRKQLEAAGIDAGDVFEQLVGIIAAAQGGDGDPDKGDGT